MFGANTAFKVESLNMARQRNNVVRLPFDARKRVCELLFDNSTYEGVRDSVEREFNIEISLHNSSLLAYSKSDEYSQYCAARRNWEKKTLPNRWAASLINDGKGIESVADLAAMELLEQIHQLSENDGLEVKDTQKLAAAVVGLKRSSSDSRAKKLQAEADEREADYQAKIATLEAQIENLTGSSKKVDSEKVADELNRILGVK